MSVKIKRKKKSEHLVGYGTDVNKEIDYYEIPLFNICLSGNKNIGKNLIELGANINKNKWML